MFPYIVTKLFFFLPKDFFCEQQLSLPARKKILKKRFSPQEKEIFCHYVKKTFGIRKHFCDCST